VSVNSNERQAVQLAQTFRSDRALGAFPIKDVFEMVRATKVDVFSIDAAEEEHGLSMLDPETERVVIVVATTHHPMRQRSSVAHELGHLLRGDLNAPEVLRPGKRAPAEICADAFARHLLLPLEAVRGRLGSAAGAASRSDLSALVQEYGVSPAIAAIQLKGAALITVETCQEWKGLTSRQLALEFGWLNQYQCLVEAARRPRAPQLLMERAVAGYRRGVLGIAELSAWYGQSAQSLRDELGEPTPAEDSGDDWDFDVPLFPGGGRDAPA